MGVTLVARVGQSLQKIPMIDRVAIPTDHPETVHIASELGVDVPFMRPQELAGDQTADRDILHHALLETERFDKTTYHYHNIVVVQPTSPMQKKEHVINTIEKVVLENLNSVWTISKTDSKCYLLKQLKIIYDHIGYF